MPDDEIVIVFEVCIHCSAHSWNTRHDEAKYLSFFEKTAACIQEFAPNTRCVMNKVPKPWYEKELYCQLVPNNDAENMFFDSVPRIGAFEISTVY